MTIVVALAVMTLCAAAEALHLRRCRRLGRLAHGPEGTPRSWVKAVPAVRVAAAGMTCWGLMVLLQLPPSFSIPGAREPATARHLLLALDVSPSMTLRDAGPSGGQTRSERGGDLLRSILDRIDMDRVRVTVVAFYNGAKPVVIDTADLEVVNNILNDLPMQYAFSPGKTTLYDGIAAAVEIARPWAAGTSTLVVVTDGDTLPGQLPQELPSSISDALVLGVGSSDHGRPIDGHMSSQNTTLLYRLAGRLGGVYHDGNRQHLPSSQLKTLFAAWDVKDDRSAGPRELAMLAVGVGSLLLALLSGALAIAGCRWQRTLKTVRVTEA